MRTSPFHGPVTAATAALFLLVGGAAPAQEEPQVLVTAAGGNSGGPATDVWLYNPQGLVFDGSGNLFIADSTYSRVRKVDPSGTISTVAGSGVLGASGDGGPATAARFQSPAGLAFGGAGTLYIADMFNNRIRKVAGGNITNFAGTGSPGFMGDGQAAAGARLNRPHGIATDATGNLFIADSGNHCIRKVDLDGNITTVAGTGGVAGSSGDGSLATSATLNTPTGVAVDAAGTLLYIADSLNHRVRKVVLGGNITTIAGTGTQGGGGTGASTQLNTPRGVACNAAGDVVLIADFGNGRIRKIAGGVISSVAGGGTNPADGVQATVARLGVVPAVAFAPDPAGPSFVVAEFNRIRRVAASGIITTVAGGGNSGDGDQATLGSLNLPKGVALDGAGSLLIADTTNMRIRKVDPSGTIGTIAGTGVGTFGGNGGPATAASLILPAGVAIDAAGNVLIADTLNNCIRKMTAHVVDGVVQPIDGTEIITTFAGIGRPGVGGFADGPVSTALLRGPSGVAVGPGNSLFIADSRNHRIRKVTSGVVATVAGSGSVDVGGFSGENVPASDAQLNFPSGVACDSSGNLFIADTANNRVRKVDTSGTITTLAGTGSRGFSGDGGPATAAELRGPSGVAVDLAGNVFIADFGNNCVRKVSPGGTITTVAGTGGPGVGGFAGDGGPATGALMSGPSGVAVDAAGNLFVADTNNHRIRALNVAAGVRFCPDETSADLVQARLEIATRDLEDIEIATLTIQPFDPVTGLPRSDKVFANGDTGVIEDANGNLVPERTFVFERPDESLFPAVLRLEGQLTGGRRFSGDASIAGAGIGDTTPPVVTASLVPADPGSGDRDDDGKWFRVSYSVSDCCDPSPAVTAVMIPHCATAAPVPVANGQLLKLKLDDARECTVKMKNGFLKISSPGVTLLVTATDASGNTSSVDEERHDD